MPYTAEDFDRVYPVYAASTPPDFKIVLAALRIAANVMRDEVLDDAVAKIILDLDPDVNGIDIIRSTVVAHAKDET